MPKTPVVNFNGARLRHVIERCGMTLTQIGAKGGVASVTVSKALAGRTLSRGTAVRIAMALGTEVEELLVSDTPATPSRAVGAA